MWGPLGVAIDLVLPRPCPGCGGIGPWCEPCGAVLDVRPRPVALPAESLDTAAGLVLPPTWALTRYRGPVRAAIIAGKERGRADLPPLLGAAAGTGLLRLARSGSLPTAMAQGRAGSPELWIVPAPTRRAAARRRGGDPVAAMARSAARTIVTTGWTAGVSPCLVTAGRARDSVGLDARTRAANLAGRVRFVGAAAPPAGCEVVLLDDVLTSGATMIASVRVLASVGVAVSGFLAVSSAAPWVTPR